MHGRSRRDRVSWPDPRGGPGAPHSTAIYKCRSTRISFRLGRLRSMKMAIPFFLGGGGGGGRGVSEKVENLVEAGSTSYKISTTKDSQKLCSFPIP